MATFLDPLSWALLLLPGTLWHQPVMAVKSRPAALLCNLSTRFGGIEDKKPSKFQDNMNTYPPILVASQFGGILWLSLVRADEVRGSVKREGTGQRVRENEHLETDAERELPAKTQSRAS